MFVIWNDQNTHDLVTRVFSFFKRRAVMLRRRPWRRGWTRWLGSFPGLSGQEEERPREQGWTYDYGRQKPETPKCFVSRDHSLPTSSRLESQMLLVTLLQPQPACKVKLLPVFYRSGAHYRNGFLTCSFLFASSLLARAVTVKTQTWACSQAPSWLAIMHARNLRAYSSGIILEHSIGCLQFCSLSLPLFSSHVEPLVAQSCLSI